MVKDKLQFNHTKSNFSKKLARLGHEEFVNKVMQEKTKLNGTASQPTVSRSASPSTSADYSFSEHSSDNPDVSATDEDEESR